MRRRERTPAQEKGNKKQAAAWGPTSMPGRDGVWSWGSRHHLLPLLAGATEERRPGPPPAVLSKEQAPLDSLHLPRRGMWVQRTWGSGSLLRPAAAVSAHMLPFAWLPPQVPLSPVRKTASTAESHRPRSLGGVEGAPQEKACYTSAGQTNTVTWNATSWQAEDGQPESQVGGSPARCVSGS